jgi:hypothetical protein
MRLLREEDDMTTQTPWDWELVIESMLNLGSSVDLDELHDDCDDSEGLDRAVDALKQRGKINVRTGPDGTTYLTRKRMPKLPKEARMLVGGSVLHCGCEAHDIDLVVREFTDERGDQAEVDLAVYESIAHATGKPIDLFFTAYADQHNVAGYYNPTTRRWTFRMAFCGRLFFEPYVEMTMAELIALASRPGRMTRDAYQQSKLDGLKAQYPELADPRPAAP